MSFKKNSVIIEFNSIMRPYLIASFPVNHLPYIGKEVNETLILYNFCRKEKERLSALALKYGLSLPELARHVLQQLSSVMPEESFDKYESPKALKTSLKKAL